MDCFRIPAKSGAEGNPWKRLTRELGSAYDSWLKEAVPDIITNEERRAFLQLSTNEEREQFVESFWDRRNPVPESAANTYKEEHYRRLAYADERFASGIPGRKTDRGHIYILWGPPDEIESHPSGGTYDRPIDQQGSGVAAFLPPQIVPERSGESTRSCSSQTRDPFVDPAAGSD
jgi:GWxTD domain-containing protein